MCGVLCVVYEFVGVIRESAACVTWPKNSGQHMLLFCLRWIGNATSRSKREALLRVEWLTSCQNGSSFILWMMVYHNTIITHTHIHTFIHIYNDGQLIASERLKAVSHQVFFGQEDFHQSHSRAVQGVVGIHSPRHIGHVSNGRVLSYNYRNYELINGNDYLKCCCHLELVFGRLHWLL